MMNRTAVRNVIGSMLPVTEPRYNLREIVKQCVLLEDHLFQKQKRCPDCIVKHFLTIEALFEEAITLDKKGTYVTFCEEMVFMVRALQEEWLYGEPERLIAQVLRKIRKAMQPYVFDMRTATKTHTEKEDEEADKLVKPLPKKKPPRKDKRKEKISPDKDPDLSNMGAEADRDLSMNYKKVASLFLARETRKPGDVWKTEKGKWTGKNKDGETQTFEKKEQAESWASGTDPKEDDDIIEDDSHMFLDDDEGNTENESRDNEEELSSPQEFEQPTFAPDQEKRPDPYSGVPDGSDIDENEQKIQEHDYGDDDNENSDQNKSDTGGAKPPKIPESSLPSPEDILGDVGSDEEDGEDGEDGEEPPHKSLGESIDKAVASFKDDAEKLAQYAKSYESAKDTNMNVVQAQAFMDSLDRIKKDLEKNPKGVEPQKLGEIVGKAEVAKKRLDMTSQMLSPEGTQALSPHTRTEPLREDERKSRMNSSLTHCLGVSPEERTKMYDSLKAELENTKEGTARYDELKASMSGIQLAAVLQEDDDSDDDNFPGEPKPNKAMRKMMRMIAGENMENIDLLTGPGSSYAGSRMRKALQEASAGLTDDEFQEWMKSTGSSAGEFTEFGDSVDMNRHMREIALDVMFNEASLIPELLREANPSVDAGQIEVIISQSKLNADDVLGSVKEDLEDDIPVDTDDICLQHFDNALESARENGEGMGPMYANMMASVENSDLSQMDTTTDPPLLGPLNPAG